MRAMAPGKLVLTGAYAVLDGAPAVVAAVDRHAIADAGVRSTRAPAEVAAAFPEADAPATDVSAQQDERGGKLGLGSSAAAVVAALAAAALVRQEDVRALAVRARIFAAARAAHARVQRGGSGVDVAASVYGGVLRYTLEATEPRIRALALPAALAISAFSSGVAARTSDLRARVDVARAERANEFGPLAAAMRCGACEAADALERADAAGFIVSARVYGKLLGDLGRLADAPIVTPEVLALAALAESQGAAFLPSGAGGGDVAVWIGRALPDAAFVARAEALAHTLLPLSIDAGGVRPFVPSP